MDDPTLEHGVRRMTTVGVGIDLVEVARIKRLIESFGKRAFERLLVDDEAAYCLSKSAPELHVAARVAAKEAAYKALSQAGADQVLWWHDIEVKLDEGGKPTLSFHGRGKEVVEKLGIGQSLVSLTHTDHQAAAVVIVQL